MCYDTTVLMKCIIETVSVGKPLSNVIIELRCSMSVCSSKERVLSGGDDGCWPPQPPTSYYIVAPPLHHRALQDVTMDNRCFTERRKKTVRFDHQHHQQQQQQQRESNEDEWDRQGSQDSHRDSGIDTSSTFTSSEESSRGGDVPKVPERVDRLCCVAE